MSYYLIDHQHIHGDEVQALQTALATVYNTKNRPLCLCKTPGIPMYIACIQGKYVMKRMPNSGSTHRPDCAAYEPPAELSGLGEIVGTAIQENIKEGTTTLKLDFALSKSGSRTAPTPNGTEADSVKTDGNKLSLRGMLHYLWEEAGLNRWSPAMSGKRNWSVIHKYLYQAAQNKIAKGIDLMDILYIPEPFMVEHKEEIIQRRLTKLMRARVSNKSSRLMLVIGEIKNIAEARFGHKIILKHCPDYHFMMNEDLHARLYKRFTDALELSETLPESHLIMIGTFRTSASGVASLEELALINVTENWIPFESISDKTLIDALTQTQRSFVKGLRYNLSSSKPLACAVLSDTPEATALYLYLPNMAQATTDEIDAMIQTSNLPAWKWQIASEPMPPLPKKKSSVNQMPTAQQVEAVA